MASTLHDSVRSVFTEALISKFAVLLGEPEGNIQKAIHGTIPMVLTDIVHKSYTAEGAAKVNSLSRQAASSDFFGQMHELTVGTGGLVAGSVLLNKGSDFSKALLAPHTEAVVNEIGRYANINIPSSSFIVGVVSFAALDTIGRHITNSNADANGLALWLRGHGETLGHTIPEGLAVRPALGLQRYPWEKPVMARRNSTLYLIITLLVLAVIGFFLYRSCGHVESTTVTTDTTIRTTTTTKDTVVSTTGPELATMKVTLPNGKVLDAYKGGTEDKLVSFLNDPTAKLDKKNGNWFDFTKVNFASNSASLLLESDQQLKNIVAILDAFPKAKIKIGGYSDNTGDSTDNVRLSQQRADNILAKLKELGAKSSQLAGAEGYGPKHPVGDNGTAEGRMMNRRMSINVKAK